MNESGQPSRTLLKRILLARPWLFVILQPLFSYKGLTPEELREATGLSIEVVKRGLWWLKKLGVLEERNNKFYVNVEFYKPLEELLLNYCRVDETHILLVDNVYIVLKVKTPRNVYHWTIEKDLLNSLYEIERFAGSRLSASDVANTLDIPISTAARLLRLRTLIEECRKQVSSAEPNHRGLSR